MITLTQDEAKAILAKLAYLDLGEMLQSAELMTAVSKLSGTYKYPASAGPASAGNQSLDNEIWHIATNDKIRMIKAVKAITGLGLKESKDYVDAKSSFLGGFLELGIDRSICNCTLATARHLTQEYATIHQYTIKV